jgi:multiple sugar transport system permease protein/raffinose/stachyose/melibiose transport system permease protein
VARACAARDRLLAWMDRAGLPALVLTAPGPVAWLTGGLPLSWPAIATVTVLQFIQIWDDLLVGLLFLQNPQQRTITVGLAALSAGRTTSIPVLRAGSFISALPAIVVYLIFQRHLVKCLTMGMGK